MKIAGIICEYNPFHLGHAHHILQTRKQTGADYIVCVMSGPFVQRGDIAIVDKWTRAQMALAGGADVVLELPALFALRAAPDFARGGVGLLAALGADYLSFGCETDRLDLLWQAAGEDPDYELNLREALKSGVSYPRAAGLAYANTFGDSALDFARMPNAALATEYLRSIRALDAKLQPVLVLRKGNAHHSDTLSEGISGSALRAALRGQPDKGAAHFEARNAMPPYAWERLSTCPLISFAALEITALYALRGMKEEQLAALPDMSEGLDRRMAHAAKTAGTLEEFLFAVKCKRYPMARIRRAVCHAMLKMDASLCAPYPQVPYARVLGFRMQSREVLKHLCDTAQKNGLDFITKRADAQPNACIALDTRAQDLMDLAAARPAGRDFTCEICRM